jgi:hypothetical protein
VSGLNRNPQNIQIYSSGYDSSPSLNSNHFSIFEMASNPYLFVLEYFSIILRDMILHQIGGGDVTVGDYIWEG